MKILASDTLKSLLGLGTSPNRGLLTVRPHDAIIIGLNEDKQQSAMSEVDLKSKFGCFLPKSPQVVLGTSRRLEVDLGSLLYQVASGVGLAH